MMTLESISSEDGVVFPARDLELFPAQLDRAEYVMIGLHGRNANKFAFFPFVRQMGFLHTQWILPSAPYADPDAPETRWWFERETHNAEQLEASRARIAGLMDAVIAQGVLAESVFLVGFSQGAVMALETALKYPERLGGVVALSGYLASPGRLATERHAANARVPVFLSHGTKDETLPVDFGRRAEVALTSFGYSVEYHEYPNGHRISSSGVRDIRAFLHRHMYGLPIDDPRLNDQHIVAF
jgi:phospholipase/carboxylesterase